MHTKVIISFIVLLSFIVESSLAQEGISGAYKISKKEIIIISGKPTNDYLMYRNTKNGHVYKLVKESDYHYTSNEEYLGKIQPIECYFIQKNKKIRALQIQKKNSISKVGTKINLLQKEFYFLSGKLKLRGMITMPKKGSNFPLMIVAQGSGKNSSIDYSYDPYLFASQGIACLTYDKRGTGKSEGTYSQDFETLSNDLIAALKNVPANIPVNMQNVGIIGYSQGGWIAPLAASKSEKIKFLVIEYGLVMSIAEEDWFELPAKMKAKGFDQKAIIELQDFNTSVHKAAKSYFEKGWEEIEQKMKFYNNREWYKALSKTNTWSGSLLQLGTDRAKKVAPAIFKSFDPFYNPVTTLEKIELPILWGFASDDIEAPSEISIQRLKALVKKQNKDYTIKTYQGADHGMYLIEKIDGKRIRIQYPKNYLKDILNWVKFQSKE